MSDKVDESKNVWTKCECGFPLPPKATRVIEESLLFHFKKKVSNPKTYICSKCGKENIY